ncbi:Aste57867_10406 [Aphanomyces stellatus]|uniref:Aste57867_10406 protein n=1 Tax=Aphanomyces stellatus TaxID=120398 RepID=A0A485KQ92_9STRA|nr:hypothetical protein As57867_010366 [Aphanomyces stellatus]VFT87280.1 Aste57867_10406 [Aphanomyces stellatus]
MLDTRLGRSDALMSEATVGTTFPSYNVDFQIKPRGLFGGLPKVVWRQFRLSGQTLSIYNGTKRLHAFHAPDVSLQWTPPHDYTLHVKTQPKLTLYVPYMGRMNRFRHVLEQATETMMWVAPPTGSRLLGVATEIIQAEQVMPTNDLQKSTLGTGDVLAHLQRLQAAHQLQQASASHMDLYIQLMSIEAKYCAGVHVDNLAHVVHMLRGTTCVSCNAQSMPRRSIQSTLSTCPYPTCNGHFAIQDVYHLHIKGNVIQCHACHQRVSLETFKVASFLANCPSFEMDIYPFLDVVPDTLPTVTVHTPAMPSDGTIQSFLHDFRQHLDQFVRPLFLRRTKAMNLLERKCAFDLTVGALLRTVQERVDVYLNGPIGDFDVDLVHAMLDHLDFARAMCVNLEYWTNPTVVEAAMVRYHKFMTLEHPHDLVPTFDIALVWQSHRCMPHKYHLHCMDVQGGRLDGRETARRCSDDTIEKRYANTFVRWAKTFNEPYSSYPPSYDAWIQGKVLLGKENPFSKHEWTQHSRLPAHECRFVGVNESFPVSDGFVGTSKRPSNAEPILEEPAAVYKAVIGTPLMDTRVLSTSHNGVAQQRNWSMEPRTTNKTMLTGACAKKRGFESRSCTPNPSSGQSSSVGCSRGVM